MREPIQTCERVTRRVVPVLLGVWGPLLSSSFFDSACETSSSGADGQSQMLIAWQDEASVLAANGPAPKLDAAKVCGSSEHTFLAEFLKTPPTNARVKREWPDANATSQPGGTQIAISGVVRTTHLGPPDVPLNHQFGEDLSLNVTLDEKFLPYTQHLGPKPGEQGEDAMHTEISDGYIPHLKPATAPKTSTWGELASENLKNIQPGFSSPAVGDRTLVMGRYIVDCGHPDYSTELHAMSFLAWAQRDGGTTRARVYYNPFRDSERYTTEFESIGRTSDVARFDDANTSTLPSQFTSEVLRAIETGERPRFYGLHDAQQVAPPEFKVCAPQTDASTEIDYRYDFVTRKGVTIRARADKPSGCIRFRVEIGQDYVPAELELHRCSLDWDDLNRNARAAEEAPQLDLKTIASELGKLVASRLDPDLEMACGDALTGPAVNDTPKGRDVRVDDTQPFPFYGVITVKQGK